MDVEGDWVHKVKRLRVDKGKGQMGMVDLEPDDEEAQAWYQVDVYHLAESSEVIARSVLEPRQRLWCLKLKHYNLDRP